MAQNDPFETYSATDHEQIARLAKALGHPARVRIVTTLLRRKTCIGSDIVEEIGLAASTTSEHLGNIRRLSAKPRAVAHVSFKSQEYRAG